VREWWRWTLRGVAVVALAADGVLLGKGWARRWMRLLVAVALFSGVALATVATATPDASSARLPRGSSSARPHTSGDDLIAVATNCGDSMVSYSPLQGQPMTAADFEALGMPPAPTNSPLATAGTQWIAPQCAPLPVGFQPGGPAALTPTTFSLTTQPSIKSMPRTR
jgi:hypothetical protein